MSSTTLLEVIAARHTKELKAPSKVILTVSGLNAWFGEAHVLKDISMQIVESEVTSLIGPSGCGKSTFLRCLNRLHEENGIAKQSGQVLLDGEDIYATRVNPVDIRRKIGMVFQKANPFPTLSVFENVVVGMRFAGIQKKALLHDIAEDALKKAALWDEVKPKLKSPAISLSGGQQQRLCIARALAVNPQILLMDEPTSALDPISTSRIEELIIHLKKAVTLIIVTHNMQQAARISDKTGFFLLGELIEFDRTATIFTNPKKLQTESYVTGRFG